MKGSEGKRYPLHRFEHNGVVSHSKVVIGAPDLHLVLGVRGMSYREFVCKPVDVVEVTVRLVVVLLLQLIGIKLFVVEFARVGGALLQVGRGPLSESGNGGLVSGGLGSLDIVAAFLRGGQLFRLSGSFKGHASVGTPLDVSRGHVDTLVLVDLDNVDALRDTGKVLNELPRTFGESSAHDGAFRGLFRELGEKRETRRGRGAQSPERGSFRTTQVGAGGGEF